MLVRILTAVVALPLFFVIVFFLPPICLTLAVSALCAVSVYELLFRTHAVTDVRYVAASCVFAAFVPLWVAYLQTFWTLLLGMFLLAVFFFACWLADEEKGSFSKLAMSMFGAVLFPFLFTTLLLLRQAEQGLVLLLVPFVGAWTTDTGAYFVGRFLGRHRLAPRISPKKTVEGAVGGVIVCILCMVAYGLVANKFFNGNFSALVMVVTGLVLSVISQVGDLSLSIIKREYNIKDYGVLFPGHGGVLDRFDSVLFTAPATYFILKLVSLI